MKMRKWMALAALGALAIIISQAHGSGYGPVLREASLTWRSIRGTACGASGYCDSMIAVHATTKLDTSAAFTLPQLAPIWVTPAATAVHPVLDSTAVYVGIRPSGAANVTLAGTFTKIFVDGSGDAKTWTLIDTSSVANPSSATYIKPVNLLKVSNSYPFYRVRVTWPAEAAGEFVGYVKWLALRGAGEEP